MEHCSREIKGNGFTVYLSILPQGGGGTDCVGLTADVEGCF